MIYTSLSKKKFIRDTKKTQKIEIEILDFKKKKKEKKQVWILINHYFLLKFWNTVTNSTEVDKDKIFWHHLRWNSDLR